MTDYKKMKVADLRKILTEQFGYTQEEVQEIKGKAALINILEEVIINEEKTKLPNLDDDLEGDLDFDKIMNGLDLVDDVENESQASKELVKLLPKDPGWTDYVLGELTDNEKIGDNPTTDGLRRLVEKFSGEIIESNTSVPQVPSKENGNRATVIVEIVIQAPYAQLRFSGAADVYEGNSQYPFCNHPVATAETKAEGRAYKRALKLRRVSTWEELDGAQETHNQTETIEGEEFPKFIKEEQLNFLDILGQRLDVDLEKFIHSKYNNVKDIKLLSYEQAGGAVGTLTSLQDNKESIDESIKGYKQNWQTQV